MTIRNHVNYQASYWDWGVFNGCFGDTEIAVSDLDGIVERHGHFLVFETKSVGAPVPIGQRRLFEAMVKTGRFCILTIWGEPGYPERMQIWTKHGVRDPQEVTLEDVRNYVSRWYRWADKRG